MHSKGVSQDSRARTHTGARAQTFNPTGPRASALDLEVMFHHPSYLRQPAVLLYLRPCSLAYANLNLNTNLSVLCSYYLDSLLLVYMLAGI